MIPPAYHPNRNQQGQWVSLTHRKDTIHTASIQQRNKTMQDRQRILKNKDLSKGEQLTAVFGQDQCACSLSKSNSRFCNTTSRYTKP